MQFMGDQNSGKMKKYIPYLVIFLIGALAGMWVHRQYHFRDATKMPQNDTIVRFDTIRYSRLELTTNSCRLDIPKIGRPELVYIPSDSVSIIYRDSVRYVTLPRQYYFTETEDAQIWHSGIDSTIDSLNVFRQTRTITQTITEAVTHRHELSIGMDLNYSDALYAPMQLRYSYNVRPWLSVYGFAEYELFRKQFGIGAGTRVRIGW